MPSQRRALEASFEPSDKPAVPPGSETIPALEDFDSFFENLNNLDSVDWRSAHPANPERRSFFHAAAKSIAKSVAQPADAREAGASAKPTAKPAAKSAAGSAAKADPFAGMRAAAAQSQWLKGAGKGMAAGEAALPARRRGMPGAFRFAATAFVLFLVGMGIGWAALSLPGKSSSDTAATITPPAPGSVISGMNSNGLAASGIAIEPKVALPSQDGTKSAKDIAKGAKATGSDRMGAIVPLTEMPAGTALMKPGEDESAATTTAKTASKPGDPPAREGMAVDLAAAKIATGSDAESLGLTGAPESSASGDGIAMNGKSPESSAKNSVAVAPARKAGLKPKPAKAAVAAVGPALNSDTQPVELSTNPIPAAATSAATSTVSGPQYAVQVGACRSTRCVENYRALVTPHLPAHADSLRVIPVPADPTGLQRVRIAPLDKAEAQQLREALIQADPRLGNAYVVAVHP